MFTSLVTAAADAPDQSRRDLPSDTRLSGRDRARSLRGWHFGGAAFQPLGCGRLDLQAAEAGLNPFAHLPACLWGQRAKSSMAGLVVAQGNGGNQYLLALRRFAQLVDELHHSHEDGQHQACCQNDENPTDVLNAQSAGLLVLILRAAVPPPPLLLHYVELVLLLELEDGNGDLVPVR